MRETSTGECGVFVEKLRELSHETLAFASRFRTSRAATRDLAVEERSGWLGDGDTVQCC